jgi:hypothetical protein
MSIVWVYLERKFYYSFAGLAWKLVRHLLHKIEKPQRDFGAKCKTKKRSSQEDKSLFRGTTSLRWISYYSFNIPQPKE